MTVVAFIGLGNMGGPMAANLAKAGHEVRGFDLVAENLKSAEASGVIASASAADAIKGATCVITMLPAGKHVIGVYEELTGKAEPGTLFIDSSTIDVQSARTAHDLARAQGHLSIDAPVSGGVGGAEAGTLTFMEQARRLRKPSHCSSPWPARFCIVAMQAPDRQPRSATT